MIMRKMRWRIDKVEGDLRWRSMRCDLGRIANLSLRMRMLRRMLSFLMIMSEEDEEEEEEEGFFFLFFL